jgi:hypothetical protein
VKNKIIITYDYSVKININKNLVNKTKVFILKFYLKKRIYKIIVKFVNGYLKMIACMCGEVYAHPNAHENCA